MKRCKPAGAFPPAVRDLLRRRFGSLCAVCGDPLPATGWTAQHRRARGMGGSRDPLTTSPANGLAVHDRCHHDRIEARPDEATAAGWRVSQGTDPATVPVLLWTGERVRLDHLGGYAAITEGAVA